MKKIFKLNLKKLIASLTATSLLISFVVGPTAASALNGNQSSEYKQIFKEFVLPYSYGKITNAHYAGTDRVIINIQDLHCHPKVQKNISNIIESFDKKFGVNKIYLEGAYGNVNTSWINDKINNNKEILEKMLDTGRLTGAEYYSSLSGKTEIIEGLEEKEPYLDNIKRLGNILQEQESIDLILKSLHKSVNNVKKKYYTKRQYKLEQLFNQYKEGKLTSQKYYTLLSKYIDKLGIDLTKYENSLIYLTLLELQKELNYKKVTVELQSLISLLKQQVPYNVYKELLENTSNFQEVEKLYSYIIQLDKIYNFDISSNYKELDKYFRYIELSKKINPVELVKEDEFLLQEINTRFSQTKAQRDVVFLVHFEKYLKDFLTTKITLDDYQYYKENMDKYITIYNKYVDNRVLSLLNDYIAQTDKFYNINMDRNTYFAQNMFNEKEPLNKLESEIITAKDDVNKIMDNIKNVKKIDVVITGGFHSQTVTEMIKNYDVSYIVITPNVYDGIKLAEDTYYELAKEQSKLSFQTIAPVIASLSPQLQAVLLNKIEIKDIEKTESIMSMNDEERARTIADLAAAKLLESDDVGNVEETLQEIIKALVDDLHKQKVTPELVSEIKNLQKLLKDKEKLQKVIDLLSEGVAKQSVMLVIGMFDDIYEQLFDFTDKERLAPKGTVSSWEGIDLDEDFEIGNDIEKLDWDNYEREEGASLHTLFSDTDIIKLCEEIIKAGHNNKNIENFVWYLGTHNIFDKEMLNKILAKLESLEDSKIDDFCGVIYSLTVREDKDKIYEEKAEKTKEKITSFFAKSEALQSSFCRVFSIVSEGYSDSLRENLFDALLGVIDEYGYGDADFDFLVDEVCRKSNLITRLETRENMYAFLNLSIEKRKLLYEFSISYLHLNLNHLTLNFILSVLNKYNFSDEQFNYIMKLICSIDLKDDVVGEEYIKRLKDKNVNLLVLEQFKYMSIYNRYIVDLLLSDIDNKHIKTITSKIQKMVDLFDDLQEYRIEALETENRGLALSIFSNDGFERYCKDNNIEDVVKQYQLAIRVSRRIYAIAGGKAFTLPDHKIDNIIKETLDYYNKIDEIISRLNLFTNKTAVFSLHNSERNLYTEEFIFTPDGIKEIFKILEIKPEVFEITEISFLDKILDFINKIEQKEIDKQTLWDFVNNLDGSKVLKKEILDYISKKKDTAISKRTLNSYISGLRTTEPIVEANRFLKIIEHFNDYNQEKGVFIFDGHGEDDRIFYSDIGSLEVEQIVRSLVKAHKNGVNLENLTLMFLSCHSYKFADNIINELEKNGITVFPQIITDAGKETVYGYTRTINVNGVEIKVSNSFFSLLKFLESKTQEEREQMEGRLTFKEFSDAPRYLSNNTMFVTNQQINKLNSELEKNILDIINEQTDEYMEPRTVRNNVTYTDTYRFYAEMMLPSTQKALNKIGNIGIIKAIYKGKSGENFRFTTLGTALGVLIETFGFWSPNFIKAHNFDPSIQAGMTAVVWVIRALSIGLGFGVGSIWALLLTETITHYFWNRLSIRAGKKNHLLQTSENLTKEQLIQKIFDVSNIDRDYKENIEDKQKLESLLNKEQIFETDIKFMLQEKDFLTDDSLLNYQKINFFFKVLVLVREKGFNIDNDLYEQIIFLMDVFTYEQSLGPISSTIINDPEVTDIENDVLRFFNLNSERRQQICDNLEEPTLDAFALMLKTVENCEQVGCTEQEIDELLMLINDSRNVMEEYYFKDFERDFFNIRNLRFYIEQKNKLPKTKSPIWLSVIYSSININSLIGNDNDKADNLIKLIRELEQVKIRKLDTEYGGLTLRIFLNEKFRNTIVKQYMMESMVGGRNKKTTILNIYRIAQKISRTLYEIMGVNISMLSEQDLNDIMETLVRDNARRRAVAKKIEFVSENTGTVAIHNMELGRYGSRRFSMIGIERVMSMLGITPKLVTDFVIKDKRDIKNEADRWLESIENFLDALEQNGLTGIRYVFDGHGSSNGLYLIGNGIDIDDIINGTDTYNHISVKEVAESLFKAYNKCVEEGKGEKFESLILDLSSCHSYEFAKKVIDELKQLEEQAGLPLRFPQIITEAGKETEVGYSVTYKYNTEKLLVGNIEASLLIYIQAEILKGREISSLTLQDLFDAQIYMSNHTMFVSSPEIESLNKTLRENLNKFLREGLVPEEGESTETDVLIDVEPDQGERLPSVVTELQLSSTQKILERIGNLGIIKSIYKGKAGSNFRFTKLGVAIGTIIELFSFWSPNFIKSHNFDPSMQARMTAVVWVIRALSIGLGAGTGVAFAVSFGPLAFLLGIPALFLTETIAHFIWNFLIVKIEKTALSLQTSKKNKHSVNGIFIKLLSIFLTVFMLMLGGYSIGSSIENTDVINIQQIDIFNNDTLDQMSNKDYQKLIDELGVDGINQLLNRIKNENAREEARAQFARHIKDSQYVELLLQSIKDENYKEFFETFDPTYNKLIKGNLGNMRAGAKEYETIMDNLGIEGVIKIILSIDDEEIKTAVVNDIIKNKYDYFLADALSKDKLDLFFDTLDSDYSHLLSMNSTETNCLLLNYFSGFNDLEVLLNYFEKNNKSEIKNTLIDKYNTELMNMYYVDLFCKAIKEGRKEEFLSLFKDKEAVVRTDIKEKKNEFLNDLLAAVKGGEPKSFLELFSEENLNNLSLEDYDRVINRLSVEEADSLLNSIENKQLREKIRQDFQNNITDERYIALLIEANTNNKFSTLFEIYDPDFEHLQSFSEEQNQGLISELETPGINKLLNGINNVDVKENMRQTFEKNITSEQYESLLISSIKSNGFESFFNIFDPNANNLKNVQFKYQSLLLNNKTEVNKFLAYVKTINNSSYYFLNNNFNKAQKILTYIDQNSNNEALKEYKDSYIYLDLSLDELKQYKEFYDYVTKKNFVNKEISFDDIISQITSEGNGKLVFQVLADYDFNKLYDNYDEKYQAAIAVTEYINSYCEFYGIEDTTVIKDTDMKQIIQYVSSAYNKYMEENAAKTIIDSKTQVVSIVGDNERNGEFVVKDFVSVLDYIKQDKNKRTFFTFDTDVDCEQLKTAFLNKLINLSEQNPNQQIFINIHAHGYPGGFVVGDSVRIITEELTDTLIQMHNNGVDLSNVTIGFNSCNTYFSSTEIYNRLKEANIENLPVIYAEAGFETKLGFSKGSVYGEETYLYTTLLNNLKNNNGKKVVVSDLYDVQADITWANPTLFVQIDNDSFDKLDKQLSAVISKYSTNTVDVSDTDKNIADLENQEDLSPEDIEFLEGDSNYSNTAFPINIFAYSIFSREQNAELNEKASIWEEIVFRAVPAIISSIYDKDKSNKLKYFDSMQYLFIYAHAISRWLTNENDVRNKMSFNMLLKQIKQEMSKGTDILASIYKDALSIRETSDQEKIKTAVIQATLKAIGLHEAYNKGFISGEEFESGKIGKYDDNVIRQMLINMGITYEFVENLINQSLFLLGFIDENVKQKVFDMSVVYDALSKYNITGEQVRTTSDNEQPSLQQNNETTVNYDRNDHVTVLLIKKADGTQYSVRLALNRIKEGETDYIRTGVPDRKMFVYLSSINDDAFSTATSKYTTLEYIERITGVKIEVTDNTIIAKSSDSDTKVSLIRSGDVRQKVTSLMPKQIPAIDQQQQADVEEIAQAKVTETIYLDEPSEEIERKFKRAIESNSLIVIYPFSHTYDMYSLTDDQMYSLYFDIQNKFFELQEMLDKYLPEIDAKRGMAYILKEFIKNAFVHGNISDPSQPIYIKFIRNGFTVINSEGKVKDESTKLNRVNLSAAATLTGTHRGLQIIRDYEEQGLIKLEQEIEPGKVKGSNYYIVTAERVYEQDQYKTKIDFNNLIERVFSIIDLIEKTNNKYPKDRAKSMTEAEQILTDTFTPEELEVIDLLASVIFDSIKYVNATRNTSAVEFVNIIYSLQNGLFNDNLLMTEGDLRQHILDMLKHYVEVSKQKKGDENILVKTVKDNENILEDMADFLTDIIVNKNLIEKVKQQREQRKINLGRFIESVQRDDSEFSAIMICSANENRSAIWHIMFEDFLKRTKRKLTKVFSAGVFYDISQEVIRQTGKARVLRDDYHDTLSTDERYKGIDEGIKSDFRSTYIEYLKVPKGSKKVFIVAGEQHRAQLIKLGYNPAWIFLMSEFYSDEFKTAFKQAHESLGKELEENNIFSMSEFPDPFEEQILRQDLPELVRSMVDYVFKTRDDAIRETLPAKFAKFTDDYNQFEHMDELPSFAFTDTEKREATRELYEDEVSDMVREKHQFKFAANTKYLYILQNRNNKDTLLDVVSREDAELKFKLLALMYLVIIRRGLTQEETNVMAVARDKIITEFKKQLENNGFNVSNNFDLRSYMMGIYLLLQDDSLNKTVPEIIYNAFIINTDGVVLANSDGYFAVTDLFTIVHELTHVVVSKPGFYSRLVADTVDELVSYVTPNMFLTMAKLSLKAYFKAQTGYTIHQTKGVIDYVKMGKKLHVLYNLFSDKTIDRDLRQEEHSAPIAFLELLFNAHSKIGKTVDWGILLEAIKTIDNEALDQSSMFEDVLDIYTKILVAKDKITKQEADNLINEIEKMQLWTLLTYDIVQNIKVSDSETYAKILGNKSTISFEEQILTKPAETKEQLKKIADAIKSKEQLSRNDILMLLIIDVVSNVDYEQLIKNFDGVIEGIMNSIRIAAQIFDMQKGTYFLSEYEQISNYITGNYSIVQNSTVSVMNDILEFISNSLDKLFFAKLLISKVFGIRDITKVLGDKKLLIVTSKQQEETLQQVLRNNGIEDIKIVTMEIITKPAEGIRSDMVLDVQKGIKARYDAKENKLIIYSKQGIDISMGEIQSLIMQEYFAERIENIISDDVIAFAGSTDTTLDDITNRLKTAYTDSVTMPNKETKFDLCSRTITNLATVCNQEFVATGIKTFVVTSEQAEKFADEIKTLKEQDFKFVIACKSDSIIDITDYDGLIIDATAIPNIGQTVKFMESLKKKVLKQGLAKQISVKFRDEVYKQFETVSIDIFNNYGIMPVVDAEKMKNIGKCEVENITENNIEQLLRSNNVIGVVIDNARVFVGKKSIIKQLFSKEHKYNKGYNASLSSKFNYVCYDITKLKDILALDINSDKQLQMLKNIELSVLNLSADSLTYLEYLKSKGRHEEMAGFIRGIAMNSARTQIINVLKEKGTDLDMDKFAKEAGGKYQKAFLTVAVQLMIEGIDITKLLETDFIDSNMTTKQYLDSVYERVNINIEDILKQNEYKIERTQDTAKTIEDFKNYVVLLDNLRIIKETTANFDMSMKAVRGMLAAA